jgi:moderate conductance mechanosensitive channel
MCAFRSSRTAISLAAIPLGLVLLLVVVLWALVVLPVLAQGAPAAAGHDAVLAASPEGAGPDGAALPAMPPEMLDDAAIRNMVARLSDAEVREMLLRQLDAVARQQARPQPTEARLLHDFQNSLQLGRARLAETLAAAPELAGVGPMIVDALTAGRDLAMGALLLAALGVFAAALAGEQVFRRLFTGVQPAPPAPRTEPAAKGMTFVDKLCILALRLMADLLSIVVFALLAIALFFIFYTGYDSIRLAFTSILWAIILPRTAAAVARFAVAPRLPDLRLVRLGDAAARAVFRGSVILVGVIGVVVLLGEFMVAIGLGAELTRLYGTTVSFIVLLSIVVWIWRWRRPVRQFILEGDTSGPPGSEPSRVRQLVAANWHIFAACFVSVIWVVSTVQRFLTDDAQTVPILVSLGVLFAIPVLDGAVRAGVSALLKIPPEGPAPGPNADPALPPPDIGAPPDDTMHANPSRRQYRAVLVRNLRLVLIVIAAVVLARVWGIDMQSMAARGVGETIAGALLEIIITLVLASAAWGIVKTAIANAVPERDTGEAEGEIGGKGRSRAETLLPLVGKFILVAIVVVTVLVVLSSLGVAIGPLIAGAGVIGIAIGFGAQTLVRDILSGIFFLVDDAFRTGEYIDTGGVRGMVEHISIRSLRLRHHRGPVHTIPFGEIHHLTNFSRDWAIEKLELRVPYDTDLEKVRKIIKSVGQELIDHPEHGPNFIQPLKSQGVNRMDDSAFIVRVKFMAKPGQQFVLRREIFRRIQQAFTDKGIHFAPRRVIVETAPSEAGTAAGAAAAIAAAESAPETQRTGIS